MDTIAEIMKYETAGDPVSGCKWTRKTTGKIARELHRMGIGISANTVGRLLKKMDYSLRRNLKSLESGLRNPPAPHVRDQQFRYIRSQIQTYAAHGLPVISVDTKSRERIGAFHQPGRQWCRHPIAVLDHDFPSDAQGVAIPYGIYDFCRNEGFVNLGTRRDTAEFAVASIRIPNGQDGITPSVQEKMGTNFCAIPKLFMVCSIVFVLISTVFAQDHVARVAPEELKTMLKQKGVVVVDINSGHTDFQLHPVFRHV